MDKIVPTTKELLTGVSFFSDDPVRFKNLKDDLAGFSLKEINAGKFNVNTRALAHVVQLLDISVQLSDYMHLSKFGCLKLNVLAQNERYNEETGLLLLSSEVYKRRVEFYLQAICRSLRAVDDEVQFCNAARLIIRTGKYYADKFSAAEVSAVAEILKAFVNLSAVVNEKKMKTSKAVRQNV